MTDWTHTPISIFMDWSTSGRQRGTETGATNCLPESTSTIDALEQKSCSALEDTPINPVITQGPSTERQQALTEWLAYAAAPFALKSTAIGTKMR